MKQAMAILVVIAFANSAFGEGYATSVLDIPAQAQATQLDAGYPMGCQITSMIYALKFGPSSWQDAYRSIPGTNDVLKIQALAAKFSGLPSQSQSLRPAFSERYGVDQNDLPWMFASLLHGENMSLFTIVWLPGSESPQPEFLSEVSVRLEASLNAGKPVLAQLYYSDLDLSHVVLITGVQKYLPDVSLTLSILDPKTGRGSEATVQPKDISLLGHRVKGLTFDDSSVVERAGVLISILQ